MSVSIKNLVRYLPNLASRDEITAEDVRRAVTWLVEEAEEPDNEQAYNSLRMQTPDGWPVSVYSPFAWVKENAGYIAEEISGRFCPDCKGSGVCPCCEQDCPSCDGDGTMGAAETAVRLYMEDRAEAMRHYDQAMRSAGKKPPHPRGRRQAKMIQPAEESAIKTKEGTNDRNDD